MAHIVSIAFTPKNIPARPADHYARVPVERVELVAGFGIAGDRKGGGKKRHLNIMCADTLKQLEAEGFRVDAGAMGEQIVVAGLTEADLADGTRWRLGANAMIEVVEPRTGCDRFEKIHQRKREEVQGRIGVMAKVIVGGEMAVGDEVVAG